MNRRWKDGPRFGTKVAIPAVNVASNDFPKVNRWPLVAVA
jgi:hypothetical protein